MSVPRVNKSATVLSASRKRCTFFDSPKGCKLALLCPFLHDNGHVEDYQQPQEQAVSSSQQHHQPRRMVNVPPRFADQRMKQAFSKQALDRPPQAQVPQQAPQQASQHASQAKRGPPLQPVPKASRVQDYCTDYLNGVCQNARCPLSHDLFDTPLPAVTVASPRLNERQWACMTCTFINDDGKSCLMCEAPRVGMLVVLIT